MTDALPLIQRYLNPVAPRFQEQHRACVKALTEGPADCFSQREAAEAAVEVFYRTQGFSAHDRLCNLAAALHAKRPEAEATIVAAVQRRAGSRFVSAVECARIPYDRPLVMRGFDCIFPATILAQGGAMANLLLTLTPAGNVPYLGLALPLAGAAAGLAIGARSAVLIARHDATLASYIDREHAAHEAV